MRDRQLVHDLVVGANRLIVDIIRAVLDADPARPPVAVLADPAAEHWREAAAFAGGVVVVMSEPTHQTVVHAVLRGADAVVDASDVAEVLPRAVAAVSAGSAFLTPLHAKAVTDALRRNGSGEGRVKLSKRESEIVQSIASGDSVKQTAIKLGITPKTVENLQSRLFRKLEVRNRAQAVAKAYELDLLAPLVEQDALHPDGGHPS